MKKEDFTKLFISRRQIMLGSLAMAGAGLLAGCEDSIDIKNSGSSLGRKCPRQSKCADYLY